MPVFSPEYKKVFNEKGNLIISNFKKPFVTDDLFHAVATIRSQSNDVKWCDGPVRRLRTSFLLRAAVVAEGVAGRLRLPR